MSCSIPEHQTSIFFFSVFSFLPLPCFSFSPPIHILSKSLSGCISVCQFNVCEVQMPEVTVFLTAWRWACLQPHTREHTLNGSTHANSSAHAHIFSSDNYLAFPITYTLFLWSVEEQDCWTKDGRKTVTRILRNRSPVEIRFFKKQPWWWAEF